MKRSHVHTITGVKQSRVSMASKVYNIFAFTQQKRKLQTLNTHDTTHHAPSLNCMNTFLLNVVPSPS